jgi:hypothetical protein
MSDAYIIELGEEAVGVIARDVNGYRFYAAKQSFRPLEGRLFHSAETARSAALELRREAPPRLSALTSLGLVAEQGRG